MNKELLEKFIKSNISLEEIPKVFNDRALRDAEYPYIVLNSSIVVYISSLHSSVSKSYADSIFPFLQ